MGSQNISDVKVLWESKAKNFQGEPYLKVKQVNNTYVYSERAGIDSIAFILYDNSSKKPFGLVHERKPSLNEFYNNENSKDDVFLTTAFGGSIDCDNLNYTEICQKEVKEESGYSVKLDDIYYVGRVLVSTQMNQICYLYFVDVSNYKQGEKELEPGEIGSEIRWFNRDEVFELMDWKAPTILTKFEHLIEKSMAGKTNNYI